MKTRFLLFLGIFSIFATEQSADKNSNIFLKESFQEGNLKNINDYINKEDGNKKEHVSISHIKGNCVIDGIKYPSQVCSKIVSFYFTSKKILDETVKSCSESQGDKNTNQETKGPTFLLLEGPPGTGKTTLGSKLAHVAGSDYQYISCSQLFDKYIGETEKSIRSVFDNAAEDIDKNKRTFIILDEIDSIGYSQDSARDESGPKVSVELQACIDKISQKENSKLLFIIGTTNRRHAISKPLLSRFTTCLKIEKPSTDQIFKKIALDMQKNGVIVDSALLKRGISRADSFRSVSLCNNETQNMSNALKSSDPKYLGEYFCDCIKNHQYKSFKDSYRDYTNSASEECRRVGPLYSTVKDIVVTCAAAYMWWTK